MNKWTSKIKHMQWGNLRKRFNKEMIHLKKNA